jgi:hypothetical protein
MAYAVLCDGCAAEIARVEAGELHIEGIWTLEMPDGLATLHLCDEQCLGRWIEKRRMERVGAGESVGEVRLDDH